MINYLPQKNIDYAKIAEYLKYSEIEQKYTNNGPVKRMLEKKLETLFELHSNKRVVCVCNGTAAMQLVMFLYRKQNINKWAIPAYTFPSAIVGNMFDVDILDISLDTYTIPIDDMVKYEGVILTNLFGTFSNIDEVVKICKDKNIKLVFDNAASPLSKYNGINICNFGDYCIGSLHHTKYIGCGEGGFVVCDKSEYDMLNVLCNFGFPNYTECMRFASNYKMSDIVAAFILNHIENFDLNKYLKVQTDLISGIGKENLFNYNDGVVYNSLPILFKNKIDISYYMDNEIVCNKYYKPLSLSALNSHYVYDRIINLPLHYDLSNEDINKIIKLTILLL
jgi:dTDP-4-amino-4,6-dideoxygalactose transaminase